ncbi:MAG: Flp pilus assembly complex ATPase component TadA [Polaromonas sp.]|nr:Flp pilus assembly complex ATPase component TadA [Gemmatimonadaceae bacterium]
MIAGLPTFQSLESLSEDELRSIMTARLGESPAAQAEQALRRIYLYAIQTHSSDVHIGGSGGHDDTAVKISIRGPNGFENFTCQGKHGRHFLEKMFALTNTPQGGSTASIVSTRFSMELPAQFARSLGLVPRGDLPYAIDVRVEYIRTVDGWKVVTRILDQERTPKYAQLGLTQALDAAVRRSISKPSGLILVSGPTGSGKSTLLNAILGLLNDGKKAIATIEDPVEYRLHGEGPITQIAVTNEVTFPKALRSILRQDPDVILVGEIRDAETMQTALSAAQTGHIVLATIHANSAPETITRALELTGSGETRHAFVLSQVLRFVVAQRLVPTYGGQGRPRDLQVDEGAWLTDNGMGFMKLIEEVDGENVIGRVPLMEGIEITPEIKALIRSPGLNAGSIYHLARDQAQYETLAMAGVRAVESRAAKLQDCLVALETTTEAQEQPALRLQAAREQRVSLTTVSEAIDRQTVAHQQGKALALEACIREVASATWEAA